MQTGAVKVWFDDKGFGFVQRDAGGPDAFVHATNLAGGRDHLKPGERVEFEDGIDRRSGRARAERVRVL